MKILAITVYAGSEKLVAMTENMLEQLEPCIALADDVCTVTIAAVSNAAVRKVRPELYDFHGESETNQGFGKAVNNAIAIHLDDHDAVLVLNNDLEFPEQHWLKNMVEAWDPNYVLSPMTDRTATKGAMADRSQIAVKGATRRLAQVSAYCWMVPSRVIRMLRARWGFPLFDPDFFCYGEDDYTSAILRKVYGATPFKVVFKSWVRHLKHQTGKELGHRGGMRENVKLLKKKMGANKLR